MGRPQLGSLMPAEVRGQVAGPRCSGSACASLTRSDLPCKCAWSMLGVVWGARSVEHRRPSEAHLTASDRPWQLQGTTPPHQVVTWVETGEAWAGCSQVRASTSHVANAHLPKSQTLAFAQGFTEQKRKSCHPQTLDSVCQGCRQLV